MTEKKTFSKSQIAKIFRVSRSTIYDWEISGMPTVPPERRGYPARLVFEDVLNWRIGKLDAVGVSEAGLDQEEQLARERAAQLDA